MDRGPASLSWLHKCDRKARFVISTNTGSISLPMGGGHSRWRFLDVPQALADVALELAERTDAELAAEFRGLLLLRVQDGAEGLHFALHFGELGAKIIQLGGVRSRSISRSWKRQNAR